MSKRFKWTWNAPEMILIRYVCVAIDIGRGKLMLMTQQYIARHVTIGFGRVEMMLMT